MNKMVKGTRNEILVLLCEISGGFQEDHLGLQGEEQRKSLYDKANSECSASRAHSLSRGFQADQNSWFTKHERRAVRQEEGEMKTRPRSVSMRVKGIQKLKRKPGMVVHSCNSS
jgi:hypothetical protein